MAVDRGPRLRQPLRHRRTFRRLLQLCYSCWLVCVYPYELRNLSLVAHAGWVKKVSCQLLSISLPDIDRFSKFLHWHVPGKGCNNQGSDTRVRTQKPGGFFGYTHLKNPPPKNPHFYFDLILVYTLYATNNAIFYCFKAFKALSY